MSSSNNNISSKDRKQINKLLNVLEKRKPQLSNLLMRFILVIILIIVFFISLDLYLYNYEPIILSKFQYSYYKDAENIPPGIDSDSKTGTGVGRNFIDAEKLGKCPAGFCAMENSTGLKRCPEGNYQLVYNTELETCTRREFCDDDFLSYAVLSNGTTNRDGKCDPGVPCRCTYQKNCNTGIISPFEVIFGSSYDPSQNNFSIGQFGSPSDTQYGYDPLLIPAPATQFCEVNPGFTSKLVNGCDFQNAVRDKLDCQNISSVIPISGSPGTSSTLAGKLNKNVTVGDSSFISDKFIDGEPNEGSYLLNNLPSQGYLEFSNKEQTIKELIYYSKLNKDNKNTITVSGIQHLESIPKTVPYGTIGFGLSWSSKGTCTNIISYELENVNCSIATDGPNFKNMLICTQQNRQPCKQGALSYNFDKIRGTNTTTNGVLTNESFTRNFCQQPKNTDIYELSNSYLQDPAFYTMSCYLGNGCNDTKLVLNNEKGLKAASGKYYPDVDVGGIQGQWEVITTSYPVLNLQVDEDSLINSQSIEPGDFWSVKTASEILITSESSSSGSSTISVQSLMSLNSFINIGEININVRPKIIVTLQKGTSYNFSVTECKYTGTTFSMGVSPVLPSGFTVEKNDTVKVLPSDMKDTSSFDSYGIVVRNENNTTGQLELANINGVAPKTVVGSFNIVIYKQFSFSGGNYNTIIDKKTKRRVYTDDGVNPILGKNGLDSSKVSPIFPPQDNSNIFLNQSNIGTAELTNTASSFQGPDEPFKIPLSMYYPVWNPVTFQQECIRCKPNLIAYPELNIGGGIQKIVIQYSGRDFLRYEYSPFGNGFVYTTASEIDFDNKINTTRVFHIKERNPSLEVGDNIMSPDLQFPVTVTTNTGTSAGYKTGYGDNLSLIPQLTYTSSFKRTFGFEESQNSQYIIPPLGDSKNETIISDNGKLNIKLEPNAVDFSVDTSNNPDGYVFGKVYRPTGQVAKSSYNDFGFYLVPTVQITEISEDGKTITTSATISSKIEDNNTYSKYIQFCRLGTTLSVGLVADLGTFIPVTGFGQDIIIDKISDGRITNIVVKNGGTQFTREELPIVTISNYYYYPNE